MIKRRPTRSTCWAGSPSRFHLAVDFAPRCLRDRCRRHPAMSSYHWRAIGSHLKHRDPHHRHCPLPRLNSPFPQHRLAEPHDTARWISFVRCTSQNTSKPGGVGSVFLRLLANHRRRACGKGILGYRFVFVILGGARAVLFVSEVSVPVLWDKRLCHRNRRQNKWPGQKSPKAALPFRGTRWTARPRKLNKICQRS